MSFVEASLVQADIKSQWQANFLQVFPTLYDRLPKRHPSDQECFKEFWEGDPSIDYEQFMKMNYKKYMRQYPSD